MSEQSAHFYQMTNSHILVQEFDYVEPASLEQAISLLSEYGSRAQVLAGGTYLLVQMKMERLAPDPVISISGLEDLNGVVSQDDGLHIGTLTTIRAVRSAPRVQTEYTALSEACAAFGSTQIQMMGTIGGNLCSGSPASDTVPALMAFDAQLVLVGPDGERALSIEQFLTEPGKTALRPGELLTCVVLPPSGFTAHEGARASFAGIESPVATQPGVGSAFIKVSRVAADLAKASAAAVLVREGNRIVYCRLALGSVGPTVLRAKGAERALVGQTFSAELALEAGRIAAEEITPIDDVRSMAWYRREVVKAIIHDVLQRAWQRAGEEKRRGDEETRRRGEPDSIRHPPRLMRHISRATHHEITLTVNGVSHRLWVRSNELLLNVLREHLHLTGTKYGCGIGECGACTVLLNGRPALSCLVLAVSADGSEVLTVEGLENVNGELDPLQDAFIQHAAFQCGYCTPGILMMSKNLLQENPHPTEDDIRDHLKGNRCRCTGFASIVRAVMSCARES